MANLIHRVGIRKHKLLAVHQSFNHLCILFLCKFVRLLTAMLHESTYCIFTHFIYIFCINLFSDGRDLTNKLQVVTQDELLHSLYYNSGALRPGAVNLCFPANLISYKYRHIKVWIRPRKKWKSSYSVLKNINNNITDIQNW